VLECRFHPGREPQPKTESKREGEQCPAKCTIQQIAAMARAGITDEQIVAVCADGEGQG
jgi:hypothetical protein